MTEIPLHMQVVSNGSKETVVDGMVPDFRDHRKKEFLVLRSANYSISEALAAVGAVSQEYNGWKNNDPLFADWAINHIWDLQHNIGTEVLLARFKRCVFLQLSIDSEVLAKRTFSPDEMTAEDKIDARAAATRYNAQAIATIFKVLDPRIGEEPPEKPAAIIHLKVDVGLNDIEEYQHRKIQAKKLLQSFTETGGVVIDGETGKVDP